MQEIAELYQEVPIAELCLTWTGSKSAFSPLLQKGVLIEASLGGTVRSVLCQGLGLDSDYLDNRINTIFLDGKPVDNVDKAVIKEGSVLALSAAMPGFVGAALRKGGFYAGMRGSITHPEENAGAQGTTGRFALKLFNQTCEELGPDLLARGVFVPESDLRDFFAARPEPLGNDLKKIVINDKECSADDLKSIGRRGGTGLLLLRVSMEA